MYEKFELTKKQAEFIRNANHRWNVACGAVRSGKSYLQIIYLAPKRILERSERKGIKLILGATRDNIERNVLEPMRNVYGESMVGEINNKNIARLFGCKVYCIGADNVRQVTKIRGSEVAYCLIDEATDMNEKVFELLKSRLSLPYSCCDIATNPDTPNHWFKRFIDSEQNGVDIYTQYYTIYDNPFLPKNYVEALEAEYANSVWYDRYILGKWTRAEGLVYPMYNNTVATEDRLYEEYCVSMDYGIQNPMVMLLWGRVGQIWYCVKEYYHSGREEGKQKTDEEYYAELDKLCEDLEVRKVYIDPSATSFIALIRRKGRFKAIKAKNVVIEGIQHTASMLSNKRIFINDCCKRTIDEFATYSWDTSKEQDTVIKENDHAMDAIRYFVQTSKVYQNKRVYNSVWN